MFYNERANSLVNCQWDIDPPIILGKIIYDNFSRPTYTISIRTIFSILLLFLEMRLARFLTKQDFPNIIIFFLAEK